MGSASFCTLWPAANSKNRRWNPVPSVPTNRLSSRGCIANVSAGCPGFVVASFVKFELANKELLTYSDAWRTSRYRQSPTGKARLLARSGFVILDPSIHRDTRRPDPPRGEPGPLRQTRREVAPRCVCSRAGRRPFMRASAGGTSAIRASRQPAPGPGDVFHLRVYPSRSSGRAASYAFPRKRRPRHFIKTIVLAKDRPLACRR